MSRNVENAKVFALMLWVPWGLVLAGNLGWNLPLLAQKQTLVWHWYPELTWKATAVWAVMLCVLWSCSALLGRLYELKKASGPATGGLWRYGTNAPEGKYLVTRRDGSIPEWLYFVLGARDPDAPGTLRDYADRCARRGRDPQYVADVRRLADDMEAQAKALGHGNPDAPPHRKDDPATIERLREAQSA